MATVCVDVFVSRYATLTSGRSPSSAKLKWSIPNIILLELDSIWKRLDIAKRYVSLSIDEFGLRP